MDQDHMREPTSPLNIELILEKILNFMELQDILSCRLVCRMWAKFGCSKLRRFNFLMRVNIVGHYEEKMGHRIHDFLKIRETSIISDLRDYFPYEKFQLGEYGVDLGTPYINKFFDLFCDMTHLKFSAETLNNTQISTLREILMFHIYKVVHLELDFPRYGYMEFPWLFPPKIWEIANPLLPNINFLSLRFSEDRTEFTSQFFLDLFRAVPNVEKLKLFEVHEKLLSFFLNDIMDITKYPLKKLLHLHISWGSGHTGEINQNHLDKLSEIGEQYLKLKSIEFSSITDNVQLRIQQNFFKTFGSTLEKIVIGKFSYFCALDTMKPAKIKYFQCEKLTELCSIDVVYEILTELETLVFGKVISGLFGLNCLLPSLMESKPHPLKKLALPPGLMDHLALPKIICGFSNLRHLEFTADDNSMKAVYQSVSQLEEILLFCDSKITDEGITGIPFKTCLRLYEDQCELSGDTNTEILRQGSPWIGNLKRLRLFQIVETNEELPPNNKISNVSVVFGFRFLLELKNLQIPKTWITDFSLYYIGKYYNLIYLDVSYCYWLTPKGLEGLKEQHPHTQIKVKNWYTNLVSKYRRNKNISIPSEYHFMKFS